MADPDGLNQLLIEMHKTMRRQEQALHELALDVAGLKALVTGEKLLRPMENRAQLFENAREKAREEHAAAFDRVLKSIDTVIERLRR